MRNIVPIKIYEYMAMGKPVITTYLPGVMKEFGRGNGVKYVKKPEYVIQKALNLDFDEESKKARKFVENNDWELLADNFQILLYNLTDEVIK
jgi:glycosyltransferase involved in cell wall biosynthesis